MPIIETKAATAAVELSATTGTVIPPNIIALLMQFLTSLLAGCVPVAANAHKRVARGGRLLARAVEGKAEELLPDVDPKMTAAATLDQADTMTPNDWTAAYSEASAAKPPA